MPWPMHLFSLLHQGDTRAIVMGRMKHRVVCNTAKQGGSGGIGGWRRVVNGPRSTTPPSRGWQSMHCIGAIKNYVRAIEGHRCTKIYEIYLYFNEINLSHYLAPLERDILLLAWGCSSFDSSRSHNLPVCVVCPLFFRP